MTSESFMFQRRSEIDGAYAALLADFRAADQAVKTPGEPWVPSIRARNAAHDRLKSFADQYAPIYLSCPA
jgi:hypothetical protein